MAKLHCNSKTCANNSDNYCCRPAIKVQGQSATNVAGTRCQSFVEIGSSVSRLADFTNANKELDIYCTATHCRYNADHICDASEIQITGPNANKMSETSCATFKAR